MKLIFNDATELVIQSADIRQDGSLLIKTISATEEELRTIFSDEFRTKKMIITERESTIATYEEYTYLNALVKYTAGILGVTLYKEKESPTERMDELEEADKKLAAENTEISSTVDSILTDILPLLFGDVTDDSDENAEPVDSSDADSGEETDAENTETK